MMISQKTHLPLFSIISLLLLLNLTPFTIYAEVGQTIMYEGYLEDPPGTPFNGTKDITFSIYDSETGGTALWSEVHYTKVSNGYYRVNLGETNPINNIILIDGQYWLGIKVGANTEVTPRDLFTGAGYSFTSYEADFAYDIADGAVTESKIADSAITDAKISATANISGSKINTTDLKINTSKEILTTNNLNFKALMPPNTFQLSETKPGNLCGKYKYKVTYVTADGETEGSKPKAYTIGNCPSSIIISDIPNDNGVIGRRIYRTRTGGYDDYAYSYYLVATEADIVNNSFTDNMDDATLVNQPWVPYSNSTGGRILFTDIDGIQRPLLTYGLTIHSNLFLGPYAGDNITSGRNNTFIGFMAGRDNTTGFTNTFIGYLSGQHNTSGHYNTFIGTDSGVQNRDGFYNTYVGAIAGFNHDKGDYNTFVGADAGHFSKEGSENVFIGYSAGENSLGDWNIFIGSGAGYRNKTNGNIAIGWAAGMSATEASGLTLIGTTAGRNITTDGNHTMIGYAAGSSLERGWANVLIGSSAGGGMTKGHGNTFLGTYTKVDDSTKSYNYSIALGYKAEVTGNNQLVVGGSDSDGLYSVTDSYWGVGVTAHQNFTPPDFTFHASGAKGLDKKGASLILAGGKGTGTGVGGQIKFQIAPASTTSSDISNSLQTVAFVDVNKIEVNGGVRLNTTTTKPLCDSTTRGTFWFMQDDITGDSAEVCAKDASGSYNWRRLF